MRVPARSIVRGALSATGLGQAVEAFRREDIACLTFDDGPDPEGTSAVMDVLAQRRARATFFVLGTRVARYPTLIGELLAEGHEVALHGLDHRNLIGSRPADVVRLTVEARDRVEQVAGGPVRWFRPPYVALHVDGWWAMRNLGLTFVASGSAVHDWDHSLSDDERLTRFRSSFTAGDVVLAHDAFAGIDDNGEAGEPPQVDRARICDGVLDVMEEQGLRAVTLSEAGNESRPRTAMRVSLRPRRVAR